MTTPSKKDLLLARRSSMQAAAVKDAGSVQARLEADRVTSALPVARTNAELMQRRVDELEAQVRELKEREAELRAQLDNVNNAEELAQLRQRIESAQEEKGAIEAGTPVFLDPTEVRESRFRDRIELAFSDDQFILLKALIEQTKGNVQPIGVRPNPDRGKGGQTYEVIYGHRRLRACRELGLKVKATIMALDDRDSVIQMNLENRGRSDLSAYEEALSMQQQLDEGIFANQVELAESLKMKRNTVNEKLAIARLPKDVVSLFADPREITIRTSLLLTRLTPETSAALDAVKRFVRANGPQSAKTIVSMLKATKTQEVTLRDSKGGLILKAVLGTDDTRIVVPRALTQDDIEQIRALLESRRDQSAVP
ncbi:MAG: ParB/RepB/Spo0J family partition protein [Rhizobiaceae bacterium]|nr:ParB/RepB/Spo0J family partition protein [Rhizobiaceae bacterium]